MSQSEKEKKDNNEYWIRVSDNINYKGRKEGNVLFNEAFNTFICGHWTYGKGPFI